MEIYTIENIKSKLDMVNNGLRVLVIGDPHFKVNNLPEVKLMTINIKELSFIIKPDFIVCLGDILHRHETIHVSPLIQSENFIECLSTIAPTYILIGNHDRPNNMTYLTNEHPFNSLKKWENVTIVDNVMSRVHSDYEFTFVPYVPTGKFDEALNGNQEYKNSKAIFAHQEFYGAKLGPIISQNGDKWDENNPLIISGHIHDYCRLQKNIIYVGTPLQHAFGDSTDKTISLFNFTDDNYEEMRIDLGLIKKIIVTLTPDKLKTFKPDLSKLTKLIIKGDDIDLKDCRKRSEIKKLLQQGISVTYKAIPKELPKIDLRKTRVKFLTRLYDTISSDNTQKLLFNYLFKDVLQN